jgi:regulator of protease activity HflC (stomatin/prohibitin superfamily)
VKKNLVAVILLCLGTLTGCQCVTIEPGYVGVVVDKLGEEKGVQEEELGAGWEILSPTKRVYVFPVFKQNYTWTKEPIDGDPTDESITFQTKEGLPVNVDIGVEYTIERDQVSTVFQTYRRGVEEITDTFLRNYVRDAFNDLGAKMSIEEAYGERRSELRERVEAMVRDLVAPSGITVHRINYASELRVPESNRKAVEDKVASVQRALQRENEKKEAEAQAQKDIAIAKGQAEANRLVSESLTPILVQMRWLEKWDGHMPTVTGGATPLIQIPTAAK